MAERQIDSRAGRTSYSIDETALALMRTKVSKLRERLFPKTENKYA